MKSMRRWPASTSVYWRSLGSKTQFPKTAPAFSGFPPSMAVECLRKGIRDGMSQACVHAALASQYIRVLAFARFEDTLSVFEKASELTLR